MKIKKITPLHIALVLFILCSITTTVYSYMFRKTNTINNEFIPGVVSCEVEEVTNETLTQKTEVTVKNTGNINTYIRVRIVSNWVNKYGAIVYKPSVMPTVEFDAASWFKDSTNDTYYYKYVVTPDNETLDLLADGKVIFLDYDAENEYFQAVEIFAEAIQAEGKSSNGVWAVEDAWPVTVNTPEKGEKYLTLK